MRRALIVGALLGVALAGCGGGSSDQGSAQQAAKSYVDARNQGDAARVCELYSQELISKLRTSNCVAFIREQTSGAATDLSLVRVSEHGDSATATIQARVGGSVANAIAPIQLTLTRENGEWKISGVGGPSSP